MSPMVLQISAGNGPVEVRRFVALLAEHLVDRCASLGALPGEVVVHGDEEAPRSVSIHLPAAPGDLGVLTGTHALVARSSDRGKKARKRWYVGVTLCPAEEAKESSLEIAPSDVTITAMRAGGPGGQHVNKTASAVRVVHRPSSVTVRVAEERSQRDNVRVALERLAAILEERAAQVARDGKAGRRLLHHKLERGRPSHTYELDRNGELLPCEKTCSR